MLSRASSDAANRVRRSKSTSSVSRPVTAPEHFDPTLAQQHAVAAAQSAFVKAHADSVTARYGSPRPEVIRTRSNASRKSLGNQGSHFPPRESSFKSLQPRAAGSGRTVSRHTRAPARVLGKIPPLQNALVADYRQAAQPAITISTDDENDRPSSQPKLYRAGHPSSASTQQIRKTRSMFYASTVQTGSPLPRSQANPNNSYLTTPPDIDAAPTVALRSGRLSAPLPSPLLSPRLPITLGPNETRDQARDKLLKGFQQRQVQKKPSFLLAPFRKRQGKGKEKQVQQLSSGGGIVSTTQYTQVETSSKSDRDCKSQKDKRSFSSSKWHKLINVFRRTSETTLPSFPVQQIDASRDYFRDPANIAPQFSIRNRSVGIPSPTEAQSQQLQSRTPSSDHERRLAARSPSRPGSRGSGKSFQSVESFAPSERSRSSSWASSTKHGRMKDRIMKRLSTVPENKHSISSMAGKPIVVSRSTEEYPPLSPLASFQRPMSQSLLDVSGGVDPKRVFSALQKEIAGNGADSHQHAPFEPVSEFDADVFGSTLERMSSCSGRQAITSIPSVDLHHGHSVDDRGRSVLDQSSGILSGHSMPFGLSVVRGTVPSGIPKRVDDFPLCRTASVHGELNYIAPDRASSIRGAVRIPTPENAVSPGLDSPADASSGNRHTINFTISQVNPLRPPSSSKYVTTPAPEVLASRKEKIDGKWKGMLKPPYQPTETSAATALQSKGKLTLGKMARRAFSSRTLKEDAINTGSVSAAQPFDQATAKIPMEDELHTQLHNAIEESPLTKVHSLLPRQAQTVGSAKDAFESPYTIKRQSPKSPKPYQPQWPRSPSVYSRNTDGDSVLPNVLAFDESSEEEEEDSEAGTILVTSPTFKAMSYPLGKKVEAAKGDSGQVRPSEEHRNFLRDSMSILSTDLSTDLPSLGAQAMYRGELTQMEGEEENEHVSPISKQLTTSTVYHAPSIHQDGPSESEMQWQHGPQSALSLPNRSLTSIATDTARTVSRRPQLNTTSSHGSSRSRRTTNSRGSSFMNDRYPLIDTGRRSKRNSGAYSRKSRSMPSSSGSSSRKTTPSSRVYSDFSGVCVGKLSDQPPNHVRQRDFSLTDVPDIEDGVLENIFAKSGEKSGQPAKRGRSMHANLLLANYTRNTSEDSHVKENKAPGVEGVDRIPRHARTTGALKALADTSKGRDETFRSLERLPSTHAIPALAPYTVSKSITAPATTETPLPPRSGITAQRTTSKLPLATRSALELRDSSTPTSSSLPLQLSASESPKKRQRQDTMYHVERHAMAGRAAVRMLQESQANTASYINGPYSSRSSTGLAGERPLHTKSSSTMLALSKEPSPGTEEPTIESRLSFPHSSPKRVLKKNTPTRGSSMTPTYFTPLTHNGSSRTTGRDTPGHRMAESFVRQREAGSGVSTPASASPVNQSSDTGFPALYHSIATSDRSDTNSPAFL